MVAVTDKQVATLRAQLAGDLDEHVRLLGELDRESDQLGYNALLAAAFIQAVERRFGVEANRAAVVEFVGDLRARSQDIAGQLNPEVAERMIMQALGVGSTDDLDAETSINAQIFITVGLIGDEELAEPGLDAFLADVRHLAEKLTG